MNEDFEEYYTAEINSTIPFNLWNWMLLFRKRWISKSWISKGFKHSHSSGEGMWCQRGRKTASIALILSSEHFSSRRIPTPEKWVLPFVRDRCSLHLYCICRGLPFSHCYYCTGTMNRLLSSTSRMCFWSSQPSLSARAIHLKTSQHFEGPVKRYEKLAAKVMVFGIIYLQGWLAYQGIKKAAEDRDKMMPKFPLFS